MNTIKRFIFLKFSKPELDWLSTTFGLIATIVTILTTNGYIDKKLGTTVAGISASLVSILIKQPDTHAPLTEETEDELQKEE